MVQPRDARKTPLTPPRELCQSARVEVRMEINKSRANLEGWWVGNQKRARPCVWPCAFGSAQTCLIELIRPALPPPWEPLAKVAAIAATPPAARPAGWDLPGRPGLRSGQSRTLCAPN